MGLDSLNLTTKTISEMTQLSYKQVAQSRQGRVVPGGVLSSLLTEFVDLSITHVEVMWETTPEFRARVLELGLSGGVLCDRLGISQYASNKLRYSAKPLPVHQYDMSEMIVKCRRVGILQ